MEKFCPLPFQNMEIYGDKVYLCCPDWSVGRYDIGDIYKDSFEDIWNSKKAVTLRKKILKGDYSLCNPDVCVFCANKTYERMFILEKDCQPVMQLRPKIVKFGHDLECNIACSICRDEIIVDNREELQKKDALIDTLFIPLLRDARIVSISGSGDAFGSRHSRKLIKRITQTYPRIRFDFLTNGLMCNERVLRETGAYNKIYKMRISLHAVTKETYGRFVLNGEKLFDTIIQNLYMLKELKKRYRFEYYIQMVVSAVNYKEMPEFAEFVKQFDAAPSFWEYRPDSKMYSEFDNTIDDIVSEAHPEHKDFLEVLKDDRLNLSPIKFSPLLYNLRMKQLGQNNEKDKEQKKDFWSFLKFKRK